VTTKVEVPAASREVTISRVFDAPRSLIFEAWTKPEHLDKWWGPDGFRNETLSMDFRVGGAWRYIMHGPDGVDYPNLMTYKEILRPERIAYVLADDEPKPATSFEGLTTFAEVSSSQTEVTMRSTFATVEERDRLIAEYGAVEGGKQTLARLADYIQQVQ
jgi:uncharacterized protein YndB with AHSA1/START domain